jgi:hypothetical protein
VFVLVSKLSCYSRVLDVQATKGRYADVNSCVCVSVCKRCSYMANQSRPPPQTPPMPNRHCPASRLRAGKHQSDTPAYITLHSATNHHTAHISRGESIILFSNRPCCCYIILHHISRVSSVLKCFNAIAIIYINVQSSYMSSPRLL